MANDLYTSIDETIYGGRTDGTPIGPLTLNSPLVGTVGVPSEGSITNASGSALNWTISVTAGATITPLSGTTPSGGSSTFTVTPSIPGNFTITLVNTSGGDVVGNGDIFTVYTPPVTTNFQARDAATYLFQSTPTGYLPSRIPTNPADGLDFDIWGPNHKWVDKHSEWNWVTPGGDWIDALGADRTTSTGNNPWATRDLPTLASGHAPQDHNMDVTAALQYVQTNNHWCAFSMRGGYSPRVVAGNFYPDASKRPRISVTYTDTTTEVLACRLTGTTSLSTSASPSTVLAEIPLPSPAETKSVFFEFERPSKPVASATMYFTCTQQNWGGGLPRQIRLEGILTPATRGVQIATGAAIAAGGELDSGLVGSPDVIWIHRYLDSAPESDFMTAHSERYSQADSSFSPHLWTGNPGDIDTNKFPYLHAGKWYNGNWPNFWDTWPSGSEGGKNLSKVLSTYTGENFAPLAPNLGALRTHCDSIEIVDGQDVYSMAGWNICDARINMPEPIFGLLDHIRIRYYQRIHVDPRWGPMTPENRKHVYRNQSILTTRWQDRSGKGGIGPGHDTTGGGVSGTSGGRMGWQMRDSWYLCDANQGGPSEPGMSVGYHLYDYQANNPLNHRYGSADIGPGERFGNKGGYGGLWPHDRWVLVEKEIKLNTVDGVTYPDYIADGFLRTWVNGRLVYERTNMVFRQLPYYAGARGRTDQIWPMRELGIRDLWLCGFYGGQTPPTEAITFFFTGLVVAHGSAGYIGPIAGIPIDDF